MSKLSFNYDDPEIHYSSHRVTDPTIAAHINRALGNAKSIINVGAGTGSYEPFDRYVVAVEPSLLMRQQRSINNKVPAIIGKAEALPFDSNAFDAAMASITIHHWPDIVKGIHELVRVSRDRVLVTTFDPDAMESFWGFDYFGEMMMSEKQKFPSIKSLVDMMGGVCEVIKIPMLLDCQDGFIEAFYGRPEAFLDPTVRKAQSAWGFLPDGVEEKLVNRLKSDLESGEWDRKNGHLRSQSQFEGSLTLIVSRKVNI